MHETFNDWCEAKFPNQSIEAIALQLPISKSSVQAYRTLVRFPNLDTQEALRAITGDELDMWAWQAHFHAERKRRRELATRLANRRKRRARA